MTSAIMKAKVDTLLDEVTGTSTHWTAAEAYAALAHAQISCINEILSIYKQRIMVDKNAELPHALAVLMVSSTSTMAASSFVVPTGFMWLINGTWDHDGSGTLEPCYVVSQDREFVFIEKNPYLVATSTSPKIYLSDIGGVLRINFLPANSGTAAYFINYLKYPTAIASGQEPTLPESAHNAIVAYAVYYLLMKDQRPQEAQVHLQNYMYEIKTLVGA